MSAADFNLSMWIVVSPRGEVIKATSQEDAEEIAMKLECTTGIYHMKRLCVNV